MATTRVIRLILLTLTIDKSAIMPLRISSISVVPPNCAKF
ncbi:Uncharacterised protein [Vibrio cholerae]|nr:Uncharacterised protein [Vibrio cholerae]